MGRKYASLYGNLQPLTGPPDSRLPAFQQVIPRRRRHARLEAPLGAPETLDFGQVFPVTYGESSEIRGPQRGGFHVSRAYDRPVENIGLELHKKSVNGGAAIDAQLFQTGARVGLHGCDEIP